jgi:hypothetical protein
MISLRARCELAIGGRDSRASDELQENLNKTTFFLQPQKEQICGG